MFNLNFDEVGNYGYDENRRLFVPRESPAPLAVANEAASSRNLELQLPAAQTWSTIQTSASTNQEDVTNSFVVDFPDGFNGFGTVDVPIVAQMGKDAVQPVVGRPVLMNVTLDVQTSTTMESEGFTVKLDTTKMLKNAVLLYTKYSTGTYHKRALMLVLGVLDYVPSYELRIDMRYNWKYQNVSGDEVSVNFALMFTGSVIKQSLVFGGLGRQSEDDDSDHGFEVV